MSDFLKLPRWLAGRKGETDPVTDDPFAHPAIRAMTQRELADLPFPRATTQILPRR